MDQVPLTTTQRNRLVGLVALRGGVETPLDRVNLLDRTGLSDFIGKLTLDATPAAFARQLVRVLDNEGQPPAFPQPVLLVLVRELRQLCAGHKDEAAFLDAVIAPFDQIEPGRVPVVESTPRRLKLFISYRRASWPFTKILARDLGTLLDADIFVDIDGVNDSNFEQSILRHLRESDAVLLVVTDETFGKRIHQPGDWVRREIALALELRKSMALALLSGLTPPAANKLPEDIRLVTRVQGVPFYPEYWDAGVGRLAEFITRVTPLEAAEDIEPIAAVGPAAEAVVDVATLPPQAPAPSGQAGLDEAMRLLNASDYDKAIMMLEAVRASGVSSRFFDLESTIRRAEAERDRAQRLAEAEAEYQLIATLAKSNVTLEQARVAWAQFRLEYQDFDSDSEDLATRLAPEPVATVGAESDRSSTGSAATGTTVAQGNPEQRALLDIMFDSAHSPEERAEAGRKLAEIGDPRPGVGLRPGGVPDIAWCEVPAGEFTMGGNHYDDEKPIRPVILPAFFIAKFPTTFAQYKAFLDAPDGYRNEQWWQKPVKLAGREQNPGDQYWPIPNHPAETVSWYDAVAYCRWLMSKLGYEVRLPTEEEWEKAARGTDGREYPWGNEYKQGNANIDETFEGFEVGTFYLERTTAAGMYPKNSSPYGVMDMSGNVWEWCSTKCRETYSVGKEDNDVQEGEPRVLRGGSWYDNRDFARAAYRDGNYPDLRSNNVGFRVVAVAPIP